MQVSKPQEHLPFMRERSDRPLPMHLTLSARNSILRQLFSVIRLDLDLGLNNITSSAMFSPRTRGNLFPSN
jgi:hypothetical protein